MRCVDIEPGNEWFVTGSADRIIKVLLTVLIISQNYHVWTRFSCGIQYLYEYALEHNYHGSIDLGFGQRHAQAVTDGAYKHGERGSG